MNLNFNIGGLQMFQEKAGTQAVRLGPHGSALRLTPWTPPLMSRHRDAQGREERGRGQGQGDWPGR